MAGDTPTRPWPLNASDRAVFMLAKEFISATQSKMIAKAHNPVNTRERNRAKRRVVNRRDLHCYGAEVPNGKDI